MPPYTYTFPPTATILVQKDTSLSTTAPRLVQQPSALASQLRRSVPQWSRHQYHSAYAESVRPTGNRPVIYSCRRHVGVCELGPCLVSGRKDPEISHNLIVLEPDRDKSVPGSA
eukprot:1233408-Rhodomonas_salina.2